MQAPCAIRLDRPALRVQEDRIRDERLLLAIAIGGATRRVFLSYPRMQMAESRPRVPSFYAIDVERARTGQVPDVGEFIRRAERAAGARLAWPAPADPAAAIDEIEHDLSVLRRLLHDTPDRRQPARRCALSVFVERRARPVAAQPLGRQSDTRWTRTTDSKRTTRRGRCSNGHRLRARPVLGVGAAEVRRLSVPVLISRRFRSSSRGRIVCSWSVWIR